MRRAFPAWLALPEPRSFGASRKRRSPGRVCCQPGFVQKLKLLAVVNSFTHVSCRASCVCEVVSSLSLDSWLIAREEARAGLLHSGKWVFSEAWGSAAGRVQGRG